MNRILFLCIIILQLGLPFISEAQNWDEIYKALPIPHDRDVLDEYGFSVAIDGNYAVVGAKADFAFVLFFNGETWVTQAKLSTLGNDRTIGESVDIWGDYIAIGSMYNDECSNYHSAIYLYHKTGPEWEDMTETAILTVSDNSVDISDANYFGTSVSISEHHIVAGAKYDNDLANNSGAVYVFSKDGPEWEDMTESVKIYPPDTLENTYFGYAIGIYENTIAVGVPHSIVNDVTIGSVYIYENEGDTWTNTSEIAKLTTSVVSEGNFFGSSLSISENDIVVGCKYDDDMGNNAGSAYVFSKEGEFWTDMTETAKLTCTDIDENDYFGSSVCILDNQIVVGTNIGKSIYVYEKSGLNWTDMTETAILSTIEVEGTERFGCSVSLSNDCIIAGSKSFNFNGGVFVFNKVETTWIDTTETQKISPVLYRTTEYNTFGQSVAIDGNYAVVGARTYDSLQGVAQVLFYNGTNWVVQAELSATDVVSSDKFGFSVGIEGDHIVVGAPNSKSTWGFHPGAAYIFSKSGSEWTDMTETVKLTASDSITRGEFGFSVSISENNIVVGAPYTNAGSETRTGAAYVFTKYGSSWTNMAETAKLTASDAYFNKYLGFSVDISGDIIVLGSPRYQAASLAYGAVYVYKKNGSEWSDMTEIAKLVSSYPTRNYLGKSVSISEDVIVASINYNDNASALIFEKTGSEWTSGTETAKLETPNPIFNNLFHPSVVTYGKHIIVGVDNYNYTPLIKGSAYIFTKQGPEWNDMADYIEIKASDESCNNRFGSQIGISGDMIIVGSPYDTGDDFRSGAAYFYKNCNVKNIIEYDICYNSDFTFTDLSISNNITENISHTSMYTAASGCDSLVIENLNIITSSHHSIEIDICVGATYVYIDGEEHTNILEDEFHISIIPGATQMGCDSLVYEIISVIHPVNSEYEVELCPKSSYTFEDGTEHPEIMADETYVSTLVGQASTGCDSTVTVNISIIPLLSSYFEVEICPTSSFTYLDGTEHTNIMADETYISILPGQASTGCDSLVTEKISVLPYINSTIEIELCPQSDYTFLDGTLVENITDDHIHINNYVGQASTGCDSLVTEVITVLPTSTTLIEEDICLGGYYAFLDGTFQTNITEDVTHTTSFTKTNGCDSLVIENLTVVPLTPIVFEEDICFGSSYTFFDGTFHENIVENISHTSSFSTIFGCDSLIIENISLLLIPDTTLEAEICMEGNYTFIDGFYQSIITENISHTSILSTVNGCDSLLTENITTIPYATSIINVDLCLGYTYVFVDGAILNNITEDMSRTTVLEEPSYTGCDSLVIENITIHLIDVSVTEQGISLMANLNGAAYQWLDCNNNFAFIDGESFQTYTAEENGAYAVLIDDGNCVNRSDCYTITSVELSELISDLGINIYPNPTQDYLNIEIDNKETTQIKLLTITGQLLIEKSFISQIKFDLKALAKASYILVLENAGRTVSHKIVVE